MMLKGRSDRAGRRRVFSVARKEEARTHGAPKSTLTMLQTFAWRTCFDILQPFHPWQESENMK